MASEKGFFLDKLIDKTIEETRADHVAFRKELLASAYAKKKEGAIEEDEFYKSIKILREKHDTLPPFALTKVEVDKYSNIIWVLKLYGQDDLKDGEEDVIKEFKGYIDEICKDFKEYVETESEKDENKERGQRGKRNIRK